MISRCHVEMIIDRGGLGEAATLEFHRRERRTNNSGEERKSVWEVFFFFVFFSPLVALAVTL